MRPTQAENLTHLEHPVVGDYWEEMFTPIATVMSVEPRHVIVQWHRPDEVLERLSRQAFAKRMRYGSLPGTWADVHPQPAATP